MKTNTIKTPTAELETLKNQYAQEQGYADWESLRWGKMSQIEETESDIDEICIRAQKAALEKAAEKVKMVMKMGDNFIDENYDMKKDELNLNSGELVNSKLFVDRTSITNPDNLIR